MIFFLSIFIYIKNSKDLPSSNVEKKYIGEK